VIQNKLNYEQAKEYLGIRSKESLLQILSEKDIKEAIVWVEEFSQIGGSIKNLIEELLEELRLLLLKKNGLVIDDALPINFSLSQITFLMKSFNEAYYLLRSSPIESLPLEIAVVEFYNNKNLNVKTQNSKP
jgi:DNA polymerase-3 subunit gamma/tau